MQRPWYKGIGQEFVSHGRVYHENEELILHAESTI